MSEIKPPHDIKELLPPEPNLWLSALVILLLTLLVTALFVFLQRWRKRRLVKPKVRDHREELREGLLRLEQDFYAQQLLSETEKRDFYRRLWDLFRGITTFKLKFPAQSMTRLELGKNLELKGPFSSERMLELTHFFSRAEAALYSDTLVDEAKLRQDLSLVKSIFERWLAPESEGPIP